MSRVSAPLFPGFSRVERVVNGTAINVVHGGDGPPLLLLHGYPQTHVMWHQIAPTLAKRFTVVCPDLRGYGDSGTPPSDDSHEPYSKRVMARDQVELMRALGFERFAVAGHDRGRPGLLHRPQPQRMVRLAGRPRRRRRCGVPALLRPGHDSRELRGLPGRRDDRSRPRRG